MVVNDISVIESLITMTMKYKRTYQTATSVPATQNLGQTEKKSSVYTPYELNTSIHSYIESSSGGVGFLGLARISIGEL